jgi:hypothetical protein
MTIAEKKASLIEKVNNIEDVELLKYLLDIIEAGNEDIHILSPKESAAIEEGIGQIENGQWITNEEANKRADEWLKKQDGLISCFLIIISEKSLPLASANGIIV